MSTTGHSIKTLARHAKTHVANHVCELNVPPNRSSVATAQYQPHQARKCQPMNEDNPFMIEATTQLRIRLKRRTRFNTTYSRRRPIPTDHHAARRSTKYNAGQTTSARTATSEKRFGVGIVVPIAMTLVTRNRLSLLEPALERGGTFGGHLSEQQAFDADVFIQVRPM